tara:strand:+ start:1678 stop:2418 length:741 start_codon:yes stop_codon:yes gene_type:complete
MKVLRKALDELSIDYNDEKIEKLSVYFEEIYKSSKNFNLTSLKTWEEIRDTLFIRSLRYAYIINTIFSKSNFLNSKNLRILDLGTGAGIPSIPIKIFYPQINLFLTESSSKKCEFLSNTVKKLDLENIKINNQRAEMLGQSKSRESFDLILTRALAKLPTLAELTIPLLKIGGIVITAKGKYPSKEIHDSHYIINILGVEKNISEKIDIPSFLPEDNFIIWKKIKESPVTFPRRDGVPKKNPILEP